MKSVCSIFFFCAESANRSTTSSIDARRSKAVRSSSNFAGFDPGHIENVVDDRQQARCGLVDGMHETFLALAQFRAHQQIGHAEDAVHGRADFVAHVGDELGLGAARFLGEGGRAAGLLGSLCNLRFELGVEGGEQLVLLVQRQLGLLALGNVRADASVARDGAAGSRGSGWPSSTTSNRWRHGVRRRRGRGAAWPACSASIRSVQPARSGDAPAVSAMERPSRSSRG